MSATAALDALAAALRDVHKLLLEVEGYQAGVMDNPIRLLQLATMDSRFAWLRPLSKLITELDEQQANTDAPTPAMLGEYRKAVETLIPASGEAADEFYSRYTTLMQQSPRIAMAHATLRRELRNIADAESNT